MKISEVLELSNKQATEWEIRLFELERTDMSQENYDLISEQIANIIIQLRSAERKLEVRKHEMISKKIKQPNIFRDIYQQCDN